VLFLIFGVLHVLWMDVFAFHITVHFIPALLITLLVVFLLSLAAYGLTMSGRVAWRWHRWRPAPWPALLRSAWRRPSPPTSKTCAPTRAHPRIALCPSIPVGEPAAGHHAHRDPPTAGWEPRR